MKTANVDQVTNNVLVDRFALVAHERGLATLDSETRRANQMFDKMRAIDTALRARGREARLALLPLLDNQNRFVRYYAAVHLLGLVPERARSIIVQEAKYAFDALCGDARGLLRAFDNGEYKPD